MRILSPEAMEAVDRLAIEEIGVPGAVLMENAALGVVDALLERYPMARRVVILCGPGNNGGDGLAVGRHLFTRGIAVDLFLVLAASEPQGDAGLQLEICRRLGLEPETLRQGDDETTQGQTLEKALGVADVAVDALFGTGLRRPLEGVFAVAVGALEHARREMRRPVVAVDLPSGLEGGLDPGPRGPAATADLTVTFAAPKLAHVFASPRYLGTVVVADLGLPVEIVERSPGAGEGILHLLTGGELGGYLQPREETGHKGTYGHLLVVAGSPGKAGAAVLAARAAVRGGAGLVTVAVPDGLQATLDGASLESMTAALPTAADGSMAQSAAAVVTELLTGKAAVAVGPGLGRSAAVAHVLSEALAEARRAAVPVVVDADGLAPWEGRLEALGGGPVDRVLTPHPGEMARLLNLPSAPITPAQRLDAVRRAAAISGAVVVLKGHRTLVAEPDGEVWVNPTGSSALATGGTGDVLTGLIASLLAQGYDPLAAAQLGVYLHGLAGDLAAASGDLRAVAAGDVVDHLAGAFRDLVSPGVAVAGECNL